MSSTYKPTEHGGLKEDGDPDMRVGAGHIYKPTEHSGLKEDGTADKRVGTGQFAYGQVDPVEAGAKGGRHEGDKETSGTTSDSSSSGNGNGEFAHGKVDPVEAGKKGGQAS
ncbi:hypothetical protein NHQ30_000834 [Ciborinia camelliae]|nr:hypothetical protein NHQ30_000834 [Ciborinia camelliae]